jgi:hypothetical protein
MDRRIGLVQFEALDWIVGIAERRWDQRCKIENSELSPCWNTCFKHGFSFHAAEISHSGGNLKESRIFNIDFTRAAPTILARGPETMITCSCNYLKSSDIEATVMEMLIADPFQLIVPGKLFKEMLARGKCCMCFPNVVDIIVKTTEAFHAGRLSDPDKVTHLQCEMTKMRIKYQHWLKSMRNGKNPMADCA